MARAIPDLRIDLLERVLHLSGRLVAVTGGQHRLGQPRHVAELDGDPAERLDEVDRAGEQCAARHPVVLGVGGILDDREAAAARIDASPAVPSVPFRSA